MENFAKYRIIKSNRSVGPLPTNQLYATDTCILETWQRRKFYVTEMHKNGVALFSVSR